MNWSQPVDDYCERTSAAFWAEPLDAVSNIAFLLAAAHGLWRWNHGRREDPALLWLALLVGVLGIGSFLFHTVATRWASLADVLPIAVFIYAYFALALSRFIGLGFAGTLLGTLTFLAASFLAAPPLQRVVGSSAGYVPALLAMLGIGGLMSLRSAGSGITVFAAGLVFAVSLGFRMIDLPLCEAWPDGTHFVWHILNALTLSLLLHAAATERSAALRAA
ncbi:ceramidase domain-containing protein [Jiella sp. M17.18]|uniref:ceramidase domain-containing protein n=1 Tax=Jiella sp. M17.18 TaxID=3234247 RepID=UPI0034DF2FD1